MRKFNISIGDTVKYKGDYGPITYKVIDRRGVWLQLRTTLAGEMYECWTSEEFLELIERKRVS